MAKVRNMAELEKGLSNVMYMAIKKAQQNIYDIIQNFINEYYKEYTPLVYDRTYQFLNSLVKSEIKKINGGWECEVYIDYDSLNYIGHSGLEVVRMINDGFHASTSLNTLDGLYKPQYDIHTKDRFWDESLYEINKTKLIVKTFEEYLRKCGLKVIVK